MITILSIIGFLLLIALLVGLAILFWCAIKGCKKGNSSGRSSVSPQSAGSNDSAANPLQQDEKAQASDEQLNETHVEIN